ncbi:MAG: PAS domain S-box protein [Ignavibacteria bacterium]|nr:PAS domain S-box protein [Ignavibacteria bacterium]
MKFFAQIRPKYVITVTLVVAALMVTSALIELSQSRDELFHVLSEQGLSLAETIERSSENILLATENLEAELAERLFNNAFFVARLDSLGLLTQRDLRRFAEANDIYRINIFDRQGNRLLGNHLQQVDHATLPEQHSPIDFIAPILRGDADRLTIGLKEARFEEGQRYAVAIRRTRPSGGAIVLNLDAANLLEFRKSMGIGRLMMDLGDNSGIEYALVQDQAGILAASSSVEQISAIEGDTLLGVALARDTTITRVTTFGGKEVFEIAKPFKLGLAPVGLIRIGLSMDEIRATEARMQRRVLVMSLVVVVIGVLSVLVIVASQNYSVLTQRYRTMQTFTGTILEQMRDAVVTIDTGERITLFNRQAEVLFGVSASSLVGRSLRQAGDPVLDCLQSLFSSTGQTEQTLRCGDGATRFVSVSLSSTSDPQGTIQSRTAVIRDLTEARRLEREMQRKEKLSAMGELASGVAHEVRNPLNAISMIAQRVGQEFSPKKGTREYKSLTKVLQAEAHRVNSIVQQFLRFARPPKLQLQPVPVKELMSHLHTLFEGQASQKNVQFSITSSCDGNIMLDRNLLTQALLNLLQNALDATSRGGTINLNCSRTSEGIVIEVTDDGRGIPEDQLEKIFNLYYSTKPDGTGMGLAVTQQIVSQHGGRIDVVSEIGKGSRFAILLPFKG